MVTDRSIETIIAQAVEAIDPATGGIVPPIQPATTFARDDAYELVGDHVYARYAAPTVDQASAVLAAIEGGADAYLFASGMGAVTAFFASLPRGAHVVAQQIMYHGAQDWLRHLAARGDIRLDLCDPADPSEPMASIEDDTAVVWIETPANPTWDLVDIAAAAEAAHAVGARLVVDSTVAPPVTTRPLELGADYVFHSATKYLNGHSDVLAGVLVTKAYDEAWDDIWTLRKQHGAAPSAFDAWLLIRGLRTLAVRYRRASDSAMAFARHFSDHPLVERVAYPGLPHHPGHEIAARQMTGGFGGMLSVLVRGGFEAAQRVALATEVFITATSLGGVESLIEHRKAVEPPHSVVPENLLRCSIGLESPDDLIADFEQALGS
jgi:cystathionine gamma-synthase